MTGTMPRRGIINLIYSIGKLREEERRTGEFWKMPPRDDIIVVDHACYGLALHHRCGARVPEDCGEPVDEVCGECGGNLKGNVTYGSAPCIQPDPNELGEFLVDLRSCLRRTFYSGRIKPPLSSA